MIVTLKDQTLRNYKILGTLGRGGMGTVYLASTVRSRKGLPAGTRVAVKVLHPHLAAQDGIVQRFKREAGLGLSIRHPRVMTTYDVGSGTVSGQELRFIVMELLEGRTLDRVLEEEGPFSESRLLSVGRQVAEGLTSFHGRGVIHRDIKPSNLFVDSEGNTKIGDLGLSRLLEPTIEISLPGTFLGSAAYAAPEQIDTEEIGPAADLYSLGVTLYELATGKNPFIAVDLRSTLLAHEKVRPAPLGQVKPGTSYFLEKVLEQLLQKDAKLRLGPAGQVARILAEQQRSDWWQDFVQGEGACARLVGSRRQFRVQRAARLHGREGAFEQLSDLLRTATVGRTGQVAVVVGEAGIGKTRLIDAALEANPDSLSTLLVSRFLPQATPTPYFPLNRALLAAFELSDLPRERRRAPLIQNLRTHLPERAVYAERFASLVDNHESGSTEVQLPHDAIPGLYAEVIRTLSVRRPIVLVIEELQWADRGSIRVLQSLASSLEAFPLALIMTSRPGARATISSESSPLEPFLESLLRQDGMLRIDLERLDQDAALRILRDVGVAKETEELLALRLHESSEGNPAFLLALIDDLRRREKLYNVDLEELRTLPLPSSINDFLERRIEDLDADARRFLEFASVFGSRFKLQPIVEGLKLDLETASELIGRLTRRYQLVRAFDQAYRFDHHLLRERIYRGIPQKQRREYHRIVARMVARESTHPHDASRASYEAGVHFSLADVKVEAARYLVGAVRYLTARSLHERAERLAVQASSIVEGLAGRSDELTAAEQFAVYESLAEVAGHLGHRQKQGEALLHAARVANKAKDASLMAQAHFLLARHDAATGRFLAALQHAEASQVSALEAGNAAQQAAALRVNAAILRTLGEIGYEDLLNRADLLAAEAGDEQGRAFGLLLLGQLHISTDRPATALETLKESLRLFEKLRDERGRGRVFLQLARVYRMFADLERAQKSVDLATRIARANNDRGLEARCLFLRGDLAMRMRRFLEAGNLLRQAAKDLEQAGDRTVHVYALVSLALLEAARHNVDGDPTLGADYANRAVALAADLGLPNQQGHAYAALAFVRLAQGLPRFAYAVSRKGLRLLGERAGGRRREAESVFIHYRCLKALERMEEALEFLSRARDLVEKQASEIEQPALRRSFLKRDPFNVAVLREARLRL